VTGSVGVALKLRKAQNGEQILALSFDELLVKDLRATALWKRPIEKRLELVNEVLNQAVNSALKDLGSIPSLSWMNQRLEISEIRLEQGEVFVIGHHLSGPMPLMARTP